MYKVLMFSVVTFVAGLGVAYIFQNPKNHSESRVLVKEDGKYIFYEVLPGTDIPINTGGTFAGQKRKGAFKLIYPLVRGTNMRDYESSVFVK